MPSLQSHFLRLVTKHVFGAKLRCIFRSIPDLRNIMEQASKHQDIPPGTEILPVLVNGVPAEWIRAPNVHTNNAILHLHGGAFVGGSPATCRELAVRLSAAAQARILVLDYRLAPEHPFPAALQDAMSAYQWLLDKSYPEKRLVIGGDSAGGGLALQTLIALREKGSALPAAAFFLSPPTDWVRFDGESYSTRAGLDPVNTLEMCKYTASLYVGDNGPETPLLSPVNMNLSGLPPLCIHTGDYEILLSDSVRLAERARAANIDVELKIWPGMWHEFQLLVRFVPEARQSIDEIGQFIVKHIG